MEAHTRIVADRARAAYAETLDATVKIQVFGQPSEAMLAALRQHAGAGVAITLHAEHLGGFMRAAKDGYELTLTRDAHEDSEAGSPGVR